MAKFPTARTRPAKNKQEDEMIAKLDALSEFEDFQAQILPALKKDLAAGLSAADIMNKYQAVVAARLVSIAATSDQQNVAIAAAKDIMDRSAGKATEKLEITNKVGEMTDEEIDALLKKHIDSVKDHDH